MTIKDLNNIRVLILIPSSGKLADGLVKWLRYTEKHAPFYIDWDVHYGRPNDSARNGIVKRFLEDKRNFTHLWQVDDDNIPPLNAFQMALHDKSIVSGVVYIWKDGEPLALIMEWNEKEKGYKQCSKAIRKINNGERLVKVDTTGTGCFICKREVYENLVSNWFRYRYDDNGIMNEGQDFLFFKKCTDIGYSIWIDGQVQVGHVKNIDILDVQHTLIRHEQRIRKEYNENNKSND